MTRKGQVLAALATMIVAGAVAWAFFHLGEDEGDAAAERDFLEAHWDFPLEPQGPVPDGFGVDQASLGADSCGACHVQQYEDWKTTPHSRTMNAGIRWQFHVFSQTESNSCMNCHAPLAEQKALVAKDMEWPNAPASSPPGFIPENFHQEGLTCAACHVREHTRVGPIHRSGFSGDEEGLPHSGFHPREEFSKSQFCSACHQFPEDGPRLNGKLRQDTYNQWRDSTYADQGMTCQSCHMPKRRHLWRGISDPEKIRTALAISVEEIGRHPGSIDLQLRLENAGAGHHLPTYMVPRINVRLVEVDAEGKPSRTVFNYPVQWKTSVDLATEEYDHRIPAGEAVTQNVRIPDPEHGSHQLELQVDVAPKEFYERMYRDMLQQADLMDEVTLSLLQQALKEAADSRFVAIRERVPFASPLSISVNPDPNPAPEGAHND